MQKQSSNQIPVNVVGSSTFGRYSKISNEKTYNMYISDDWLISYAGWKKVLQFIVGTSVQGRGVFRSVRNNILVVVSNSVVYKVSSGMQVTFIGNLATSVGPVFMDENLSNQICIVDKLDAYIYNYELGSLTRQNLTETFIPNYVCYQNAQFLLGNGDTSNEGSKWYAMRTASPTTIEIATELALQTKPDYAIAVIRIPGGSDNVMVFGNTVTEIWTQIGGLQNYQRNSSLSIDIGCVNVETIATSDQFVMWIGINEFNSPCVMLFQGSKSKAVSTDGIDNLLRLIKYPNQSMAFFKKEDGHLFYQFTFYNPEDNLSLFYDVNNDKFFHTSDQNLNYHPARKMVYFNNDLYFININNGCLYKSNTELTTYNENITGRDPALIKEIPRIRICSPIRNTDSMQFRSRDLRVTIDQGNDELAQNAELIADINYIITEDEDVIVTQTGDPMIMQNETTIDVMDLMSYRPRVDLSYSIDGGVTYSSTVGIVLHSLGNRKNILRWTNPFGNANDLVFKFHFWGKSYWCVNNGVVTIY